MREIECAEREYPSNIGKSFTIFLSDEIGTLFAEFLVDQERPEEDQIWLWNSLWRPRIVLFRILRETIARANTFCAFFQCEAASDKAGLINVLTSGQMDRCWFLRLPKLMPQRWNILALIESCLQRPILSNLTINKLEKSLYFSVIFLQHYFSCKEYINNYLRWILQFEHLLQYLQWYGSSHQKHRLVSWLDLAIKRVPSINLRLMVFPWSVAGTN